MSGTATVSFINRGTRVQWLQRPSRTEGSLVQSSPPRSSRTLRHSPLMCSVASLLLNAMKGLSRGWFNWLLCFIIWLTGQTGVRTYTGNPGCRDLLGSVGVTHGSTVGSLAGGWSGKLPWICVALALLFLTGTQTAFGQHNLETKFRPGN